MSAKKTAVAVAAPVDMMALLQQFMAAQAAVPAAAKPAAKPAAAVVDPAKAVVEKLIAAGGKVTRTGKSGFTPKGFPKAWVDITVGGVRIQGNAFLTGK